MYDHIMNKFYFKSMNDPHVYLDENNMRMVMNFRNAFGRLASYLIREGKKDSAQRVLDRCMEVMPGSTVPYNFFVLPLADGYYKTGETKKGDEIVEKLYTLTSEDLAWLFSFPDADLKESDMELQQDLMTMQRLSAMVKENKRDALAQKSEACFDQYYQIYMSKVYQPRRQQ